jgi:uncharacterized delta-60 repeat protein
VPSLPPSPSPPAEPTPTPFVAPGALDPAFGDGGIAILHLAEAAYPFTRGLRVEPDGATKILFEVISGSGTQNPLREAVLMPDGLPDLRVGSTGITDVMPELGVSRAAWMADGGILAAGWLGDERVLLRLTPRGSLDPSFGTDGMVKVCCGFVPLDDGRIVVLDTSKPYQALLRLLDARGAPVGDFGDGGVVPVPNPDPTQVAFIDPVGAAVDPEGRLIVSGTFEVSIDLEPVVFALDRQGRLDASFGVGGIGRTTNFFGNGGSLAIAPDGAILVAVTGGVSRFTHDGHYDPSFVLATGQLSFQVLPDGRIVTAGTDLVPDVPRQQDCANRAGPTCLRFAFLTESFLPDGSHDPSFGDHGSVITDPAGDSGAQETYLYAMALAPEGRLTVAGSSCSKPFVCDLAVVRYGFTRR